MAQPKKKSAFPIFRWLVMLALPWAWIALSHYGKLDFFEQRTIDWRFQHRGPIAAPVSLIYIDIDSKTISDIGNWPWSRHFFASVTDALLNRAGVSAIGYDIMLTPKAPAEIADLKRMRAGDVELGQLVFRPLAAKPPPVVFAASFAAMQFRAGEGRVVHREFPFVASDPRRPTEITPPEISALETPSGAALSPPIVGLIDTVASGTRTIGAWAPSQTGEFNHMGVELARLYWNLPKSAVKRSADHIDFLRADGSVLHRMPLREQQLVDINWFGEWGAEPDMHLSFVDVYNYAQMLKSANAEEKKTGEEFFGQEEWKNAVVLVGPVDPILQDLAATPFNDQPVPKVSVHGNLLKTIVSGLYLQKLPPWANHAILFTLTLAISVFAAEGGARGLRSKLTAALILTAYVFLAFYLFQTQHIVLPLVAPVGAVFTTSFTAIIWQLITEEKQKGRIKSMFSTYLSPQLVNRMVESGEDPKLGGAEEKITAYFSDIQGFSGFSEKLQPTQLVELMNEYLTACTDIITEQGGTLDKYIGDAVVVIFGAPVALSDHAYRACVATQLVHQKLGELREKWKAEGDKWPEIVWKMQSRIGLNTGEAIVGNMGSRTRFNYTMMGDNVNLAARMESGAKSWGTYTMCTEATRQECLKHGGDRVVFRALSKLVVMGREQPVPVYEIVGLKEFVTDRTRECISLFEQGLAKYYARDWEGAVVLFKRSAELEPNQPGKTPGVKTNPSLVYLEKVVPEAIEESPAADWDGRYVMKEK